MINEQTGNSHRHHTLEFDMLPLCRLRFEQKFVVNWIIEIFLNSRMMMNRIHMNLKFSSRGGGKSIWLREKHFPHWMRNVWLAPLAFLTDDEIRLVNENFQISRGSRKHFFRQCKIILIYILNRAISELNNELITFVNESFIASVYIILKNSWRIQFLLNFLV